jgi:hypothetical protein
MELRENVDICSIISLADIDNKFFAFCDTYASLDDKTLYRMRT